MFSFASVPMSLIMSSTTPVLNLSMNIIKFIEMFLVQCR
jgi:hypothetical protein